MYYRLEGHTPIPCSIDRLVRMPPELRRVARTYLEGFEVSTVFLELDHGYGDGPPVLFETMVFSQAEGHRYEEDMRRYHTWDEAEAGHAEIVANLKKELGLDNPSIPMGRRQIRGS